jgi:hypothetical protein
VLQCCVTGQSACHCVAGYLLAARFLCWGCWCYKSCSVNGIALFLKGIYIYIYIFEVNVLYNSVAVVTISGGP